MAARSCVIPVKAVAQRAITTLDGLATGGQPDPVQQAFIDEQAAQCGYCLNGMIMTAKALLAENPDPSEAQIREALRFNLCRCGRTWRSCARCNALASCCARPQTGMARHERA